MNNDDEEGWSEMPNGDKISYGGIADDGALIINVIKSVPINTITVTFTAFRTDQDLTNP